MTLQKKLKKTIRARSQKTGESYAAARRHVLRAREKAELVSLPSPGEQAIQEVAAAAVPALPAPASTRATSPTRGAVTDESARKKTGYGLDHWFAVLDAFDAPAKGHTAAAAHLHEAHGVPGWHAQGITVAYERTRGLRELNQACTGTFQVSVSKTVPATVADVIAALKSADRRAAWLRGADPGLVQALDAAFAGEKPREIKTKGSDYAWLRFPWDGRTVEIRITGKPKGASVVADNAGLPAPELVEQRRAQWRTALAGLLRHLGG